MSILEGFRYGLYFIRLCVIWAEDTKDGPSRTPAHDDAKNAICDKFCKSIPVSMYAKIGGDETDQEEETARAHCRYLEEYG